MIRLAPIVLAALPLAACADETTLALEDCNAELARLQNDRRAYVDAMPDRLRTAGVELAASESVPDDLETQEVFLEIHAELDMLENRLLVQTARCNELARGQT